MKRQQIKNRTTRNKFAIVVVFILFCSVFSLYGEFNVRNVPSSIPGYTEVDLDFLRQINPKVKHFLKKDLKGDEKQELVILYRDPDNSLLAVYEKVGFNWEMDFYSLLFTPFTAGSELHDFMEYRDSALYESQEQWEKYRKLLDEQWKNVLFIREEGEVPTGFIVRIVGSGMKFLAPFAPPHYVVIDEKADNKIYYIRNVSNKPIEDSWSDITWENYEYTYWDESGWISTETKLNTLLLDKLYRVKKDTFLDSRKLSDFSDLFWFLHENFNSLLDNTWLDTYTKYIEISGDVSTERIETITGVLKKRLELPDEGFLKHVQKIGEESCFRLMYSAVYMDERLVRIDKINRPDTALNEIPEKSQGKEALLKQGKEALLKQEKEALLKQEKEALLKQEKEALLKQEKEALLKQENEALLKQEKEALLKQEKEALLKQEKEALLKQEKKRLENEKVPVETGKGKRTKIPEKDRIFLAEKYKEQQARREKFIVEKKKQEEIEKRRKVVKPVVKKFLHSGYVKYEQYAYHPAKAFDGKPETAWLEDNPGKGIGEFIGFELDREITIDSIEVQPGFFVEKWFSSNNRVKSLRIKLDNTNYTFQFRDRMIPQRGQLARPVSFGKAFFYIKDIYSSKKDNDTAISEIKFYYKNKEIQIDLREVEKYVK